MMRSTITGILPAVALACLAGGVRAQPVAPPAAASPASAPDPADLARRARGIAHARLQQLGPGYEARIDAKRHIVYVSAVDPGNLQLVMGLLSAHHDYQLRSLFTHRLRWNITVVLPTLRDYRRMVPNAKATGFYHFPSRTLYGISFSDVLVHEFVHALHHNDMVQAGQRHPIWLVEGLATLLQRGRFEGGKLVIRAGQDLPELQAALAAGKDARGRPMPSLAELLQLDQRAFMARAESCYRMARYVMLHLYRRGKLEEFYRAYKAGYREDPTGRKTLEKVLAADLATVEKNWRDWVLALKPPWRPAYKLRPHLGVRMEETPEGVKITGFVRRSQAARLGLLRAGDVILSVAGQPTPTPRKLTAAVQNCKVGSVVDIEVIREDKTIVLKHLLGLMPK